MPDGIFVSGTISGIEFVYARAIYMAGIDHLYQFQMNLSTKMVSDGNAGYCIPDARFETSFRHIFRHWFNLFRGNFSAWNAINQFSINLSTNGTWPFMPILYLFKYKWHLMDVPDNWFWMWVVRWVSGTVSGIDFIYAGAISTPEIQENDHLHWFSMNLSTDGVWWRVQWNQ